MDSLTRYHLATHQDGTWHVIDMMTGEPADMALPACAVGSGAVVQIAEQDGRNGLAPVADLNRAICLVGRRTPSQPRNCALLPLNAVYLKLLPVVRRWRDLVTGVFMRVGEAVQVSSSPTQNNSRNKRACQDNPYDNWI